MKITLLGTGAAEGVPSIFCNCKTCEISRINKGRNIRRRSSAMINEELLIDCGPDLFASCSSLGLSLDKIIGILVTHCHFDHFYPENLEIRGPRYQWGLESIINIIANSSVFYKLSQLGYKDEELHIKRIIPYFYNEIILQNFKITPIVANHAKEYGGAMNYVITDGNKTILYASDTGIYAEEQYKKLEHYFFDGIIVDATSALRDYSSKNHMNLNGIIEMKQNLFEKSIIDEKTIIVATHFSHDSNPPHDELSRELAKFDIICGYDGLMIDL